MESKAKKLGFWSIVLLTINSIIGSGIFLSPGSVIAKSGANAPLVYLIAGLFAAVLAITFAAAAKYVSKGGAAYAYTKAAFGDDVGFYIGITRYFSASIAWGVMATAVVKTTMSIFGMDSSNFTSLTIGFIILMGILFFINVFGTKVIEIVSNLSTIGKLAALITTIVAGFLIVILTGQNNFSAVEQITTEEMRAMGVSGYVMAVISAFYAFTGFESVASGSEDMENPEKNLPKAIPLGILIVAIIYIGIVLSAMMINPVAIAESKEVVGLVSVFENPVIRNIILYGALISMFGINVASSFHTPRVIEAMANQGQVPKVLAKRLDNGMPLIAMIVTVVIAIVIPMSFGYNMGSIMIISSIVRFAQFVMVPLAVIAFFYGKNKNPIVDGVDKNLTTDVIIPILALLLTLLLLAKFNWVGQFTVDAGDGARIPNYMAIGSMIVGFIVVPLGLGLYNKNRLKNN